MPEHCEPLKQSVVLMGVSGSGKSTIGKLLAAKTGSPFYDGDDFHPPENIAKMSSGVPLDDDDRAGWLAALRDLLDQSKQPIIIACSALKQKYRHLLDEAKYPPRYVYLEGSRDLLLARLNERTGHFMTAALLDSQLATLEPPLAGSANFQTISIDLSPEQIVSQIIP